MTPRSASYKRKSGEKGYVHYYRCPRAYGYDGECSHRKHHRADELESEVWNRITSLLRNPERLRIGFDRYIEEERRAHCGDPEREAKVWLGRIADVDRQRANAQDLAIEGLLKPHELKAKLAALEETRETARRELAALEERRKRIADLERDRDELFETYTVTAFEGLDYFSPEDRNYTYRRLRASVVVPPDGPPDVSCELMPKLDLSKEEPTPASGANSSARP
jgi:hypothetical protein